MKKSELRRPFRAGQIWSSDLALSILIFGAASIIAFLLFNNAVYDRSYEEVGDQAVFASRIIMTEGYPAHWVPDDVIRGGLLADKHVSLRKLRAIKDIQVDKVRASLRITDHFYVSVFNSNNSAIGMMGVCRVGDAAALGMPGNSTLPAMALSDDVGTIFDGLNISISSKLQTENISRYDVVIVKGNISKMASLTSDQILLSFDEESSRGLTFIVIGDPGAPILGIFVNETNSTVIDVANSSTTLGLDSGDVINLSIDTPLPTISAPRGATNFDVVAVANSRIAIASWLYHDSTVWYFATENGTIDSVPFKDSISKMINSTVVVSWPSCDGLTALSATQVAHDDAIVAYHDQLLTIRTVVWRER